MPERSGSDANAQFLAAWQEHYVQEAVVTGDPAEVNLPNDWQSSLDRLFSAGLQVSEMLDAITITMDREDVADDNLFRYFCGACWTTLRTDRGEPHRQQQHPETKNELPRLPRSVVRMVACPSCGAAIGEPCIGARGKPREANHGERVLAAASSSAPD